MLHHNKIYKLLVLTNKDNSRLWADLTLKRQIESETTLPFAYGSKWDPAHNFSDKKLLYLHENERAGEEHFNKNAFKIRETLWQWPVNDI